MAGKAEGVTSAFRPPEMARYRRFRRSDASNINFLSDPSISSMAPARSRSRGVRSVSDIGLRSHSASIPAAVSAMSISTRDETICRIDAWQPLARSTVQADPSSAELYPGQHPPTLGPRPRARRAARGAAPLSSWLRSEIGHSASRSGALLRCCQGALRPLELPSKPAGGWPTSTGVGQGTAHGRSARSSLGRGNAPCDCGRLSRSIDGAG
jgi:hypothetical protein